MSWHKFIFSEERSYRICRHLIFWLLWWAYFASTYYYYLQVGLQKITFGSLSSILIIKTFLLVLIHLLACYAFIYVLLPRYLLKAKYFALTAGIILLTLLLLATGYWVHTQIFPFVDTVYQLKPPVSNNTIWWTSINSVLLNAPKVIAAASAIKLIKHWYLKQKEKEKVEKQKLVTDLQLLKAQIRPGFLFNSLDQISLHAQGKSPKAAELLIKLSDLLSYFLYECDDPDVPLEKELAIMKEYMLLEKNRHAHEIEMEIQIKGSVKNNRIAPLLLFPFIENSFRQCKQVTEMPWVNLEINVENNVLTMKLMNGISIPDAEIPTLSPEINAIQKRLELLYPQNHELKMYPEQEMYMVYLKIVLNTPHPSYPENPVFISDTNHQFTNEYALQ